MKFPVVKAGTWIATIVGMNTQHHTTSRGFSLIELLIVVAVIGLIAAIAIPNLVNAIQRARQTRSVADLNSLAKAVSMYGQDFADYPVQASLASVESLREPLTTYMANFNAHDGWMRDFMYVSDGADYTMLSYGLDGAESLPYTRGPTGFFDEDIVMNNGMFMQWPEGVQQ